MSFERERGFSVPELLIAVLLFVSLAVATLATLHGFVSALDRRPTAKSGGVALEAEIARIRSDAKTAFAVFIPQNDVLGQQNITHLAGVPPHEVDFYAKTDSGQETWWGYRYDAPQHTLQRYDYNPQTHPPTYGVFDRATGTIDTGAQYPPLRGITSFAATSVEADQLGDPAHNAYSGLVSGLTNGTVPRADPVGFVPAAGARADLFGGNATVDLAIATERGSRDLHLVSGAMASGFTIPKTLAIRALTYSTITHHRSWFGLVSKSTGHVYEQLQYRMLADKTNTWKLWCDWELYGIGPGMNLDDPNRRFRPETDYHESTGFALFIVTHDGLLGSRSYPNPCSPQYPTATSTLPPPPTPAPVETIPACFYAGTCWPPDAPPDWSPPSPWPSASPPPWWCAGHAQSPLCGGPGPAPTSTPIASGPMPAPPPNLATFVARAGPSRERLTHGF